MSIIINPGSVIGKEEKGWTNTHAVALKYANEWFYKPMLDEGFEDIEMIDPNEEVDGRWKFIFKHKITGVEIELEVHGIDNLEAYQKQYIFQPKTYWNGSSCSSPEIKEFKKEGFKPVITYKKI